MISICLFFGDGLCYLVCVSIVFFILLLNLQALENNIQITEAGGKRRIIGTNKYIYKCNIHACEKNQCLCVMVTFGNFVNKLIIIEKRAIPLIDHDSGQIFAKNNIVNVPEKRF